MNEKPDKVKIDENILRGGIDCIQGSDLAALIEKLNPVEKSSVEKSEPGAAVRGVKRRTGFRYGFNSLNKSNEIYTINFLVYCDYKKIDGKDSDGFQTLKVDLSEKEFQSFIELVKEKTKKENEEASFNGNCFLLRRN